MQTKYIGLALFEISTSTVKMYEENILEIEASSQEEAEKLLTAYGKESSHEYKNEKDELVQKSFMQIIDISEVLYEEAENNVRELYSRHFDDLEAYKKIEKITK